MATKTFKKLFIGSLLVGIGIALSKKQPVVKVGKFNKKFLIPNIIYNTEEIKPGGRLDKHWKPIEIDPVAYLGRNEEKREGFYYDPEEAIVKFNLYGLEFGNWMNQEDRMNFLYASLVTFSDMAKVLHVSKDKIGLKGKLALALGARGKGGFAAAHYESYYSVINLTKTAGKGSLVHEWGHAFDHFIMYDTCGKRGFASTNQGISCDQAETLNEIIDQVLYNEDGSPTSYKKWLRGKSQYFNRRMEIWARICERYFHTKFKEAGISNAWGVDRSPGSDWPEKNLVDNVSSLIGRLFRDILS